MNVLGIGIDIVDVLKLAKKDLTLISKRILSDEELDQYHSYTNKQAQLLFLAGRFAAKEAIFKCFKKGDLTANYRDFTILNDENGAPYVISKYLVNKEILISISHIDFAAISNCMLISK